MHTGKEIEQAFGEVSRMNASKISKAALREAKIIAQVDAKFILVRLNGHDDADNGQPVLVAIDQHAGDERVKVEGLLQELCTPPDSSDIPLSSQNGLQSAIKTILLDKPVRFSVPVQEAEMLKRCVTHFAAWGILFDTEPVDANARDALISVRTLPPIIAQRCRLEPKLLIAMLRSEVWKREESGARTPHNDYEISSNEDRAWLKRISSCPRDLLDMVNSRACRSAVMFNDELTREECQELVQRLAGCVFPFQCAHGRPSMVPLIDLGVFCGDAEGFAFGGEGKGQGGEEDFAGAWARWRGVREGDNVYGEDRVRER
jgi:DNA mismatch repair protein MLH3